MYHISIPFNKATQEEEELYGAKPAGLRAPVRLILGAMNAAHHTQQHTIVVKLPVGCLLPKVCCRQYCRLCIAECVLPVVVCCRSLLPHY